MGPLSTPGTQSSDYPQHRNGVVRSRAHDLCELLYFDVGEIDLLTHLSRVSYDEVPEDENGGQEKNEMSRLLR